MKKLVDLEDDSGDRCVFDEQAIRSQIRDYENFIDKAVKLLPAEPTSEEAPYVGATLLKIEEVQAELEILRARIDFNSFAEFVMTDDETLKPLRQSRIHRRWSDLCAQVRNLIIWSHRESGKTTQISVARTVWELGRNPNLRCLILSNTNGIAQKIVKAIAGLIEENERLKKVFPHLKPNPKGPWTNNELQVVRESNSPSPSVRACGIHGAVTGMRVDRLVVDDILDFENTNTEAERKKTLGWYLATIPGCLTKRARVVIVGTAYHPSDFIHDMAKIKGYVWRRFPLISDVGKITWPEAWDEERIEEKRNLLGPSEFARQFLCKARDDGEARFKQEWIDAALKKGVGVPLIMSIEELLDEMSAEDAALVKVFTGVDLSTGKKKKKKSDLTSFFTLLQYPNGDRRVAMVDAGKYTGPTIIEKIEQNHLNYGGIIAVEDNGAQSYILQFASAGSNVPVVPHTTGKAKRDPVLGVEGLAIELANGKWIIPCASMTMIHPEISAWITEMLFFDPKAHTGDRLMSCYFAREVARRYAGEARSVPGVAVRVLGGSTTPSSSEPTEVYRSGVSLKKLFDVPDMP